MGPETLAQVLRPLEGMFTAKQYPKLLVGLEVSDDAAVYKIDDEVAIVLTIDFFTPVVDDPYDYGAIAAANAMSDVYAMGGEVTLALNVSGFPADLPPEIAAEILRGGAEKVAEAGGALAGGHTLDAREPLYGLAVMGLIHPERVWTKGGGQPGDALVLTKPLGVGVVTTALKGGVAKPAHVAEAVESMTRLNRDAARLIGQVGVHACTDVTGFALLGHAYEMAQKGGVRLRFFFDTLPFVSGAVGYADDNLFPVGSCNNQRAYENAVHFASDLSGEMQLLLLTPETSGGLLAAVPPERLDELIALFAGEGHPCWVIGEVAEGEGIEVLIARP
jgi:selenide,water dikinase